MIRKVGIESLYYITHIDNIASILEKGILSHSQIENNNIKSQTIYNTQVINRRSKRIVSEDKSLWDFANLYFQPRNAMLYSLIRQDNKSIDELAILAIKKNILNKKNIYITSGNAASYDSKILSKEEAKPFLSKIREQIDKDFWKKEDGSLRKMMAECLVPEKVNPKYIQNIYVGSEQCKKTLELKLNHCERISQGEISIVVEPKRFFEPTWRTRISIAKNIFLVKGDMFFSRMQTLTISVNCVGVMGKGLASTAKYRFPDVYVKYQDICKQKILKMGDPYIYKRESSIFDDLSDDYLFLKDIENNNQTWFLLFPTKNHWRNKSNLEEIEQGLKWLSTNYKKQGITSLAIPALGCGLGGLKWEEVGPLICKYAKSMDINVAIYLPTDQEIPNELISEEFLLSQS